jgi:hypothetical protein
LDDVELNMSMLLPLWWLRPETLPVPKRLREMASRLIIDGRRRCVAEGVFGAEFADVRNLKTPYW